ncbi:MAG: DUF1934 domain-containing protein [Oscillospiraceae bacterium]
MEKLKENAIITIYSSQYEDGEKNESELITEGVYRIKGGLANISYAETELTGFEGSETSVTVRRSEYACVERKGTANSTLILETEKKHHCYYSTPYGAMNMGIFTHTIENSLDETGGTLYMKYSVDINSAHISDNEIKLVISLKNN